MIKKCIFFTLFISLSSSIFSQPGPLIFAISNGDEITIAADSRRIFFESSDHSKGPIAFTDSARRIFKLGKYMMAVSGPLVLGQEFVSKIIDNFNRIHIRDEGVYKALKHFATYLDRKYPLNLFPERKDMALLAGGYFNGRSEIAAINSSPDSTTDIGEFISDKKAYKYAAADFDKYSSVFDEIHNTIHDYGEGENKKNEGGGPISIVKITNENEIIWIKNNFSAEKYALASDFYKAVKSNSVKINCIVPGCEVRFLRLLRE